jgi:hypothetical protein
MFVIIPQDDVPINWSTLFTKQTGGSLLLSKLVCKKCYCKVWYAPAAKSGISWNENHDQLFSSGMIVCPFRENVGALQDTSNPPPMRCPYKFEHAVAEALRAD